MGDNPNWKPILDVLPDMLHEAVKPVLAQWDQGVNAKLESERKKYEPYKQFIDGNVDPNYLVQAYQLAEQIRDDPADVVARMNQTFDLGYVTPDEAAAIQATNHNSSDDNDLGLEDMGNLEDNPQFKALQTGITQLTEELTKMTQKQQQDAEAADFQSYMGELHSSHGEFNDRFVTALIAQGLTGEAAIEEYRKEIGAAAGDGSNSNPQQQQQGQADSSSNGTPPVVLDGRPAGSGSDQQPVDFGKMSKTDVNAYVNQLLSHAGETQQ